MSHTTDEDIEQLLRNLPLRKPSPGMDAVILRPARTVGRWAWAGSLGATAAVLAVAMMAPWRIPSGSPVGNIGVQVAGLTTTAAAQGAILPRLEDTVWRTDYEGVRLLDDQTPVRQYRRQILQRVRMVDPDRGIRIEMTQPQEEVVYVKASFQ